MANKVKLELMWPGKENRLNPEPRILIEDEAKSYSKPIPQVDTLLPQDGVEPTFDNMLIHGDNLLALKALEQDYTGKIKCIYIDPPYNTGNAFEHYDDGVEHSIWLSLMRERLEILWKLLTPDGLLAIQIDDNEFARLYLLMIEICQEQNLKIICVKMSEATGVKMASVNKAGSIPKIKEFIILAKKDGIKNLYLEKVAKEQWDTEYKTYMDNISDADIEKIKNIVDDENRSEEDVAFVDNKLKEITFCNVNDASKKQCGKNASEEWCFEHANRIVQFATLTGGARDLAIEKKLSYEQIPSAFSIQTKQKKMYLIKGEFNHQTELSRCKILFADLYLSTNPGDLWTDIKTTGLDNEGCVDFKKSKKPERLIKRIISLNTKTGDIVLDSFLGSGTTAAVAHKMGRKWIGIEMGDHCYTHCAVRLQKVIDGADNGGITKAVNWKGGGGFKFYELASSLIIKDRYGKDIIDPKYNAEMLAEAMCKLMGYKYAPDKEVYWKQGHAFEKSFIYTTTMGMQPEMLDGIAKTLGDANLLICCGAFAGDTKAYPNITVKKIPAAVLKKCEWGRPGYPLPVREDFKDEDFEFEDE